MANCPEQLRPPTNRGSGGLFTDKNRLQLVQASPDTGTKQVEKPREHTSKRLYFFCSWWAVLGSNQWPLPCEGSALPLS